MDRMCFIVIVILHICIDRGDGHWKERDRENLRHDIELYRKMAEKIEREIESFYDEYPDERYKGGNVDRIQYKHVTYKPGRKTGTEKQKVQEKNERTFLQGIHSNETSDQSSQHEVEGFSSSETTPYKPPESSVDSNRKYFSQTNSTWPKFEDILSAMGKKYDWKNDRWIKVKDKIKNNNKIDNNEATEPKLVDTSSEFHEKHKFHYKIVKLKSKSRRNVVVAVSAVR